MSALLYISRVIASVRFDSDVWDRYPLRRLRWLHMRLLRRHQTRGTGMDRRLLGPMLVLLLLEVDPRISLKPLNGLALLNGQSRPLIIIRSVVIAAVVASIFLPPSPFFAWKCSPRSCACVCSRRTLTLALSS